MRNFDAILARMPRLSIDKRWRWWREQLGSPRFVMAPMVLQSELAFRQLARRHGCELCYSPMLPAAAFLGSREAGEPEHPETGGPQTRDGHQPRFSDLQMSFRKSELSELARSHTI